MLHRGGNAIDAALAAAITLCVVEPMSTGVGGDAVAMVWDGTTLIGLNAAGRSPAGIDPAKFFRAGRVPVFGWDSVTVPGAVSGWVALSERFGALPFRELFEPGLRYATDGFVVLPVTAGGWAQASRWFRDFPEFGKAFLPNGRPPAAGELVRLPELAESLLDVADSGGTSLYSGRLAERIASHAASSGACLTRADLAAHAPEWVTPIEVGHRGFTVHELPPSCQGLPVLQALAILDRLPAAEDPVQALHQQIEAARVAMSEARRHIADPAAMVASVSDLLGADHLDELARRVDPRRARDQGYRDPHDRGTVCVTTADSEGRMVALVQSIYSGSGVVVPGTGILLHNRGAAFTADPHHPNRIQPGIRPYNSNVPAFVTRDGRPVLAFGLMGGAMQPQGHLQLLLRMLDGGQGPQTAVDAPRWRIERGVGLAVEPGFDPRILADLGTRGHQVEEGRSAAGGFGAAQLVARTGSGYLAAADARRDSLACGF